MSRKYLTLFSLSGLILCLDQLTKYLAFSRLEPGQDKELISGFLSLTLTRNNGFAFGLLRRAPASFQDIFFIAIPVFALILIVMIFIKLRDNQVTTSTALTCILAGAIGNLIDRIQYGFVIDFVRLHIQDWIGFPVLNVADCAILTGVGIMVYKTLQPRHEEPRHA